MLILTRRPDESIIIQAGFLCIRYSKPVCNGPFVCGIFPGKCFELNFFDKPLLLLGIFGEGVPLFLGFFWAFCLRLIAGKVSTRPHAHPGCA